jgi:hypothetical protein
MTTKNGIKKANKSANGDNGGIIGANPLVIQWIEKYIEPADDKKMLDFGAGKTARQTSRLLDKGYRVTAHDFADNLVEGIHDFSALDKTYDMVFASSVLNIQTSVKMLIDTVNTVKSVLPVGGDFVYNFPQPNYTGIDTKDFLAIMELAFGDEPVVFKVGSGKVYGSIK